jgi:hypothetical protein
MRIDLLAFLEPGGATVTASVVPEAGPERTVTVKDLPSTGGSKVIERQPSLAAGDHLDIAAQYSSSNNGIGRSG